MVTASLVASVASDRPRISTFSSTQPNSGASTPTTTMRENQAGQFQANRNCQ